MPEDLRHRIVNIALAGMSNMTAASVTNPIDVIKIRMQLDGELKPRDLTKTRRYRGFIPSVIHVARHDGVTGFYRGLTASLMREGTYSSIRLGLYEPVKETVFGAKDRSHTSLWIKVCAGAITGTIGSAIANPTDLVKIRMQAERPISGEPRYANTLNAFQEITRKEGFFGLWRGCTPTVLRAALLTATQVPSYDHAKHTLINFAILPEGITLHLTCSMFAGLVTATVTSPVDVMKTRLMNQTLCNVTGRPTVYHGLLDALAKIARQEGLHGFYKGWFMNWFRIGPHTVISLMIFEQLRKLCGIAPV